MRTNQPHPEGFTPFKYLTYEDLYSMPDDTILLNSANRKKGWTAIYLKDYFQATYPTNLESNVNEVLRRMEYKVKP